MPSLIILFELGEDEVELLRCWRLLRSAPVHHRQDVLTALQQSVEDCGCEEEEREEVLDPHPLGPVVHCAAVRDLRRAAPLAVKGSHDIPIL